MPLDATLPESSHGPPSSPGRRLCLTVVHHANRLLIGRFSPMTRGVPVVIGRDSPVLGPGTLCDPLLSRRHAELRADGETALVVRDLGSLNGTTVNGTREREAVVGPGDIVGVGGLLLLVHVRGAVAESGRPFTPLVGSSAALLDVLRQVDQVAGRPTTVLVSGDTGVGKELVARAIHERSRRAGRFVAVNCGAFGEGVLHSELFGHERGAFSGAATRRPGLVAAAEGGTLFLDEIGDAPAPLQVSLLRLLQEGEYRPVGSDHLVRADVRFVAATHRPLEGDVASGAFRRDLYARVARWVIRVPPLRDRLEDLPVLFDHFVGVHGGAAPPTKELALRLLRHPWPGNVRELSSVVERLVVDARGAEKLAVPAWLEDALQPVAVAATDAPAKPAIASRAPEEPRKRAEKPSGEDLLALLDDHGGNMRALARALGVGRSTLYRWFRELGVDPNAARSTTS